LVKKTGTQKERTGSRKSLSRERGTGKRVRKPTKDYFRILGRVALRKRAKQRPILDMIRQRGSKVPRRGKKTTKVVSWGKKKNGSAWQYVSWVQRGMKGIETGSLEEHGRRYGRSGGTIHLLQDFGRNESASESRR